MLRGMKPTPVQEFQQRFQEICQDKGHGPGQGQQTVIAREFGVVPNTARKWLLGLGMPELQMAIRIANWAGVNVTWLLQGAGPKHGTKVSMTSVLIDEALRAMPFAASADVLDYMKFKLQAQLSATDPRRSRYEAAIAALAESLRPKGDDLRPFAAPDKQPAAA